MTVLLPPTLINVKHHRHKILSKIYCGYTAEDSVCRLPAGGKIQLLEIPSIWRALFHWPESEAPNTGCDW